MNFKSSITCLAMEDLYKYLRNVLGDTADLIALDRELSIRQGKILLDKPTQEQANREIKIGNVTMQDRIKSSLFDL